MMDATGTTSYAYDSLNRLTQITYPTGLTVGYTYNETGRITSIATPYAGVAYSYDNANRLSSITLPNSQQVVYQYDAAGNLLQVEYPNGTAAAYAYDTRNRLTAMTNHAPANTVISTYAFTLDGVGNRTKIDLNEPMMPSYNPETINYTYSLGNILNTADGATYTHDANGNRTSKATGTNVTSYTYDSLNRLNQTSTTSRQIQYIYNGLGQRVGKIDTGVQTNYLIDPNGILPQVLSETDASNNLLAFYVYDGAGLVAKITPGNQYYFYHYDSLGSTIAITDNAGQVVNTYCYSPEGLVGAQETILNPFTYVGRFGVMAEGNGLYYMRARYYDPETGIFISKDPIGYLGGLNLFTYVGGNPLNRIDPLGLAVVILNDPIKDLFGSDGGCGESSGASKIVQYLIGGIAIAAIVANNVTAEGSIDDYLIPIIAGSMFAAAQPTVRYDPAKVGPLEDAYGVGRPLPTPETPPNRPKNWNKMSKWQKTKWILKNRVFWGAGHILNPPH
jgi:RHS repeat-associated protein